MKGKIISILFALVLVVSFSLVTAVPAAAIKPPPPPAEPDAIVFPFELGGKADSNYVAEWSDAQIHDGSSSVYLATIGGTVGVTGDEARILIDLSDLPEGEELTLGELESISWYEYLVGGYPPHIDILLDVDKDGTYDGYPDDDKLVFEYAYNSLDHYNLEAPIPYGAITGDWYQTFSDDDNGPNVIGDLASAWAGSGPAGPPGAPEFIFHTLAEWKAGVTYTTNAEKTVDSSTPVMALEIEVDNWGVQSEAYVDGIVINDMPIFGQIQDAIDSVSGESPFIYVAAGTYNEDITIDKSLSLVGEDRDTTFIVGTLTIPANGVIVSGLTINSGSKDWTIAVTGDNVFLTDLNLINDSSGGAAVNVGVGLGVDRFTFTNSTVDSAFGGVYAPPDYAHETGSSNVLIDHVSFTYDGQYGVMLQGATTVVVTRCEFNLTGTGEFNMGVGLGPVSGAEVSGNDFNGPGSAPSTGIVLAAWWWPSQDITIQGNSISGFGNGIWSWAPELGSGVEISGNTFEDNSIQVLDEAEGLVIEDVLANNTFDRAVVVDHASLLSTIWSSIQDGVDEATGGDTVIVAAGEYTEDVTVKTVGITIQGESLDAIVDGGFILQADGITINTLTIKNGTTSRHQAIRVEMCDTVRIINNDLIGAGGPGAGVGIHGDGDEATIDNNKIHAWRLGIYLGSGAKDNNITHNEIYHNFRYGIGWSEASGTEVKYNDIYDNGDSGVEAYQGTGNAVNYNNIYGNGKYGVVSGCVEDGDVVGAGEAVDATNNWWDSPNGPQHADNTFNVGFQGEKVTDNVDYVPWLDAAYPAVTSFAPVNNITQETKFSSIQAAIDDAATVSGDTVKVAAGTYTPPDDAVISINKRLTLLGANAGVNPMTEERGPESIIDGSLHVPPSYGWGTVLIGGETGTVFDGFTVKNTYHYGIEAAKGATIQNNIVDNAGGDVKDTLGILLYGDGFTVLNNLVTNNWDGIYLQSPFSNSIISGNKVTNSTGEGAITLDGSCVDNTITNNILVDNDGAGVYFFSTAIGCTGNKINFNNISGNADGGVIYDASDAAEHPVDATYNWWGHPTGPNRELPHGKHGKGVGKGVGKGDKVSDNVDYMPWLHKWKKVVSEKKPAYAQHVVLDKTGKYGWNTFSTPIFLDDEADTWKELYDLTDLDYSLAYRFDSDTQEFVHLPKTDEYAINPGEGFFIKMKEVGSLSILYSTEEHLIPPSRGLKAGWNLIGLANLEDMNVDDAFFSIATVAGIAGYSQVVSPIGNASPGPVLAGGTIYVGESYWVYMLGARTLAGFTMTPVDWVP